ncbi:hypothetical protein [Paenibacillus agaridevorans]|uniref:hypothetical protein n=1 Tax=Paenibacillus agaridevorans TaxID=171404 RepID=UPI001BE41951|nr:hypothetical protein [Paenibacillus agaridevorans]
MDLLSKIFNYAIISTALITFIRAIALLRVSKIERALSNDEKKILIHIVKFVGLTLLFSVFSFAIFVQIFNEGTDLGYESLLENIMAALIIGFMITMVIYMYTPIIILIKGREKFYYIDHKDYGQLYLLRFNSNEQIILSNKRDLDIDDAIIILLKKEDILSIPIKCEVKKNDIVKEVRDAIEKKKNRKNLKG